MELKILRISARTSDLARLQAYQVGEKIQKAYPGTEIKYLFRKSLGDINLNDPLWKMPEKGVFTEDFLKDILEDQTDLVVHSWKDLPTEKSSETEIVMTLPRADQRDLLLMKKSSVGKTNLQIFSSSPRREYNLTECLPTLLPWKSQSIKFLPVRGNVQTRVRKWKEDTTIDGLIVAKAAMDRLLTDPHQEFAETKAFLHSSITSELWMSLPLSLNPTAAAQGALAVEIKKSRVDLKKVLAKINHDLTFASVNEERNILKSYGGGCHQKIGVSVLPKNSGFALSLRGLTDAGVKLNNWEYNNPQPLPNYDASDLGALKSDGMVRVTARVTQPKGTHKALWVSRADAWPSDWDRNSGQIVWSAGVQTWQKLAQNGLWVNGTSDGLGEELPLVAHLAPIVEGEKLEWYKLTHQQSEVPTSMGKLVTYNLDFAGADVLDLVNKKMIYWRSRSQFEWVASELAKKGQRINAECVACGPGSTYEFLRTQFPKEKIFVFLSEREWREKCQAN